MAVVLTGTPSFVAQTGNNGNAYETAVTVPADCTLILVFSIGTYSGLSDLDWLNFVSVDDGVDFTSIVTNNSTGDPYDCQAWYLESTIHSSTFPASGSRTLYWRHTNHPSEGGGFVVVFCKGNHVEAGSIIVDTDVSVGPGDGDFDASMTGGVSGDLTFISQCGYNGEIEGQGTGQTTITSASNDNSTTWQLDYEDGENSPNIDSDDISYSGGLAFIIAQAAAGGGTTPHSAFGIALHGPFGGPI